MNPDHKINKPHLLREAVRSAIPAANGNHLTTFGIRPKHPETGFGYIKMGQPIKAAQNCFIVDKFEEKPNLWLDVRWPVEDAKPAHSTSIEVTIGNWIGVLGRIWKGIWYGVG